MLLLSASSSVLPQLLSSAIFATSFLLLTLLFKLLLFIILPVCILSKDAALVLVDQVLPLDLLLLLRGAVVSGLCAQLSFRAALNDFSEGATAVFAIFLDLELLGNLNSAQYLSVGTETLLDLLLVLSEALLPSNSLRSSSLALGYVGSVVC